MGNGIAMFRSKKTVESNNVSLNRVYMGSVEKFILSVYTNFPKAESMWLILSSKLGQKSFLSYARSECCNECCDLFLALSEIRLHDTKTIDYLLQKLINISRLYFRQNSPLSSAIKKEIKTEITNITENNENKELSYDYLINLTIQLQNEMVNIMVNELLDEYLNTKYYDTWRAAESSHAIATTPNDKSASLESSLNFTVRTKVKSDMKKVIEPTDVTSKALSNLENTMFQEIIGIGDSWMVSLIAATEILPISFILSHAKEIMTEGKSPIVFVNKQFEKISGFERSNLIGQDLIELYFFNKELGQSPKDKMKSLNRYIGNIKRTKKNGEIIHSIAGLKTVFDEKNNPVYVIGFFIDIDEKNMNLIDLKMELAKKLLGLLPSELIMSE